MRKAQGDQFVSDHQKKTRTMEVLFNILYLVLLDYEEKERQQIGIKIKFTNSVVGFS